MNQDNKLAFNLHTYNSYVPATLTSTLHHQETNNTTATSNTPSTELTPIPPCIDSNVSSTTINPIFKLASIKESKFDPRILPPEPSSASLTALYSSSSSSSNSSNDSREEVEKIYPQQYYNSSASSSSDNNEKKRKKKHKKFDSTKPFDQTKKSNEKQSSSPENDDLQVVLRPLPTSPFEYLKRPGSVFDNTLGLNNNKGSLFSSLSSGQQPDSLTSQEKRDAKIKEKVKLDSEEEANSVEADLSIDYLEM